MTHGFESALETLLVTFQVNSWGLTAIENLGPVQCGVEVDGIVASRKRDGTPELSELCLCYIKP